MSWFVVLLALISGHAVAGANPFESDVSESTNLPLPEPTEWELKEQKARYSVYVSDVLNSDFDATKAEVMLAMPIQKALKYFPQKNQCWSWINRCKLSQTLRALSETQSLVYTIIDMPWPLSDRDFVFLTEMEGSTALTSSDESGIDAKIKLIFVPSQAHVETAHLHKKKGLVRGFSHATYELKALDENQTKLTMFMHTEFGGNVSAGLINSKLVKELEKDVKTLIKMTNQMKKQKT